MFSTKHLEGRIRYETDKVVCIDVYCKPQFLSERPFFTQILFSIINKQYSFLDASLWGKNGAIMSEKEIRDEIAEGIQQYINIRKKLELDDKIESS